MELHLPQRRRQHCCIDDAPLRRPRWTAAAPPCPSLSAIHSPMASSSSLPPRPLDSATTLAPRSTPCSVRSARRSRTTSTSAWNTNCPTQCGLSAGYVGSRGLFLPLGTADLNQLDLGTIAAHGASLASPRTHLARWSPISGPPSSRPPTPTAGAAHGSAVGSLQQFPAVWQRQLRRRQRCRGPRLSRRRL